MSTRFLDITVAGYLCAALVACSPSSSSEPRKASRDEEPKVHLGGMEQVLAEKEKTKRASLAKAERREHAKRVVTATLRSSKIDPVDWSCFGAKLGEYELPDCNLADDPRIRGFLNAFDHGLEKVDLVHMMAPDLKGQVYLEVTLSAEGVADRKKFRRGGVGCCTACEYCFGELCIAV